MDNIYNEEQSSWLQCPICHKQTKTRICSSSVLLHFPLYCGRCRKEILVSVVENKLVIEKMQ